MQPEKEGSHWQLSIDFNLGVKPHLMGSRKVHASRNRASTKIDVPLRSHTYSFSNNTREHKCTLRPIFTGRLWAGDGSDDSWIFEDLSPDATRKGRFSLAAEYRLQLGCETALIGTKKSSGLKKTGVNKY